MKKRKVIGFAVIVAIAVFDVLVYRHHIAKSLNSEIPICYPQGKPGANP